jgi:Concanavalin A-like lectin/glucanases superfamily
MTFPFPHIGVGGAFTSMGLLEYGDTFDADVPAVHTIPATVQAGDLLVLYMQGSNFALATPPASITPPGYTVIRDWIPATYTNQRESLWFKIATAADAGATITGYTGDAAGGYVSIVALFTFRADQPITQAFLPFPATFQSLNGNPTPQVQFAAGKLPPLMVFGLYDSDEDVPARTFTPPKSGENPFLPVGVVDTSPLWLAWKFYGGGSVPVNHTIDYDKPVGSTVSTLVSWMIVFGPPGGNDEFTKLLLHFDGNDGDTTTTDSSPTAKLPSFGGTASIDTAESKFGGSSLLLPGASNGSYCSVPTSGDFNLGNGEWTVDFWFKRGAPPYPSAAYMFSKHHTGIEGFMFYGRSYVEGHVGITVYVDAAFTGIGSSIFPDTPPTWHHYAAVRAGTTLMLFVDGIMSTPKTLTGSINWSPEPLYIGKISTNTNERFKGWIEEFRFSKGIARWTANFSPPTAPYY